MSEQEHELNGDPSQSYSMGDVQQAMYGGQNVPQTPQNDDPSLAEMGESGGEGHSTPDGKGGRYRTRKPYTITKPREKWTDDEHQHFLEALKLYNRDWKKVQEHVKTKSVIQIRSHAQKYFEKITKSGGQAEVAIPPPRPKRKSTTPKSKTTSFSDLSSAQGKFPQHPGMIASPEVLAASYLANPAQLNQWLTAGLVGAGLVTIPILAQPEGAELQKQLEDQIKKAFSEPQEPKEGDNTQVPNYEKIYAFIGSLFDPGRYNHHELMSHLGVADKDCLRVLMHNLAVTLSTQQFQEEYHMLVTQEATKYLQQMQNPQIAAQAYTQAMQSNPLYYQNAHQYALYAQQYAQLAGTQGYPGHGDGQLTAEQLAQAQQLQGMTPEQLAQMQGHMTEEQIAQMQHYQQAQVQQLTVPQLIQMQQSIGPERFAQQVAPFLSQEQLQAFQQQATAPEGHDTSMNDTSSHESAAELNQSKTNE